VRSFAPAHFVVQQEKENLGCDVIKWCFDQVETKFLETGADPINNFVS
jgi:hypothetical protein